MKEGKFKIAVVARMKHGALYEAIKKRGWTLKQAAEFLGMGHSNLCGVINLKEKPSFLFSSKVNEEKKRKARELTEKLMELTNMTVDDLFPKAFRTDEFLDKPKVFERTAEVSLDRLVGYAETLALPPAPDEELMRKEDYGEVLEIVNEFSSIAQRDVQQVWLEGKKIGKVANERGVSRTAVLSVIKTAGRKMQEKLRKRRQMELIRALTKGVKL